MTVSFIRKSTQRISSWPGGSALHPKAEYICADLSTRSSLFPCRQTADHTFPGCSERRLYDKATYRPSEEKRVYRYEHLLLTILQREYHIHIRISSI
jgi:hypothetical protein